MTYLWPSGQPIRVKADSVGMPLRFRWQGRSHVVEGVARRWRVDAEWWRGRIWREYFKLYTHSGLLVIIFQDLLSGEWFLQRLYD